MGRPEDDNEFGLGGVDEALNRAHGVEKRHESHGFFEKAWSITEGSAYGSVIVTAGVLVPGPLAMQALFALDPRLRRVQMAADRSLNIAPQLMIDVSLGIGQNLLQGVLPMLGSLAMYAGGGAIIGGAIGAVGGLGVLDEATIPGGLLAGFEIGLMIGGFMGLKDILMEAAKRLHLFVNFSIDAAELAWYAGDGRMVSEDQDINAAAKLFAVSIAELWWVLLQALIAYVMKRAFETGGQAVGKYMETPAFKGALADAVQRSSKFGKTFTDWFSNNFAEIKAVVEARTRKLQQLEEGDRGGSQGNKPKPKPAPPTPTTRTYGKNTVTWFRDSQGRVVKVEAKLSESSSGLKRKYAETKAQGDVADQGLSTDAGGHIVGHRFVSDQGDINMFPQDANFNNSAYKTMENEFADWTKNGDTVDATWTFDPPGQVRPDTVTVKYNVTDPSGEVIYSKNRTFLNQAGQTFVRVPSADMPGY